MYTKLQAALGAEQAESAYCAGRPRGTQAPGVVGNIILELDYTSPSALATFVTRLESYLSREGFRRPYFVAPKGAQDLSTANVSKSPCDVPTSLDSQEPTDAILDNGSSDLVERRPQPAAVVREQSDRATQVTSTDIPTRSPKRRRRKPCASSPAWRDDRIDHERNEMWSEESHRAFQTMLAGQNYVNRHRLDPSKYQRLTNYLLDPSTDPTHPNGRKDHKTRYQSARWLLKDGRLYRKPHPERVGSLRRHLDKHEVWDVLTAEHLMSGHSGRDGLKRILVKKYIGYTLQEITLVLRECRRCSGKHNVASDEIVQGGQ